MREALGPIPGTAFLSAQRWQQPKIGGPLVSVDDGLAKLKSPPPEFKLLGVEAVMIRIMRALRRRRLRVTRDSYTFAHAVSWVISDVALRASRSVARLHYFAVPWPRAFGAKCTLPEWSKGVESFSTRASCVGSNLTGVNISCCFRMIAM